MKKLKFPSKERLGELKRQGIVSFSGAATQAFVAAGVCLALGALLKYFTKEYTSTKLLTDALTHESMISLLQNFTLLILLTSLLAVVVGILSVILQTRLTPRIALLRPAFLFHISRFTVLWQLVLAALGVFVGFRVESRLAPSLVTLLGPNIEPGAEYNKLQQAGISVQSLNSVGLWLLLIGVILAVAARVRYLFAHRQLDVR